MSEAERRAPRGWWSRLVGADGEATSLEDAVQQLALELTAMKELVDRTAAERDALREASTRKIEQLAATVTRAKAELNQVRAAAERQVTALRAHVDETRLEAARDRAAAEEKLRDAATSDRERLRRTAKLEEDLATLRQSLSRVEKERTLVVITLTDARRELLHAKQRADVLEAEVTDARTSILALQSRLDEAFAQVEHQGHCHFVDSERARLVRRVLSNALLCVVGRPGARLAVDIASRREEIPLLELLASTGMDDEDDVPVDP